MVKVFFNKLKIVFFLVLISTPTLAVETKGFNFYFAAGPNFVFPTSYRFGWSQLEVGMLSRYLFGVNKTFQIKDSAIYAGFGAGINTDTPKNIGFQSSVGVNYNLFWKIGLRTEMIAHANLNGATYSNGLLGISYGF